MKSLEKENQDPKKSNSPNKDLTVGKPETVYAILFAFVWKYYFSTTV